MLLADCDRLAISNSLTRIVLEVWEINASARLFFCNCGYREFGAKMIHPIWVLAVPSLRGRREMRKRIDALRSIAAAHDEKNELAAAANDLNSQRFYPSSSTIDLVQFGVNTTTEIRQLYLWEQLYKDFCRDSLAGLGSATLDPSSLRGTEAAIRDC